MPRIFISHSSINDHQALALRVWLAEEGWSSDKDVFLDIHPDSGVVAGQRWLDALEDANSRCEAVVFLVSEAWLSSKWCNDEMRLAQTLNKKIFTLLIEEIDLERLPNGMVAEWQVVSLHSPAYSKEAKRFRTNHPLTNEPDTSYFSVDGLQRLKNGLIKAGVGADSFELQPDVDGPFGWRMPYRGLEPLQAEDAAVFFGRDADIVRGIDTLRGLIARPSPRMLVILGASGAGKSSFLRAGLIPRLQRDDELWVPFPPIRVVDHGAFDGPEGLLSSLTSVLERFQQRVNRAELRDSISTPEKFISLLHELRQQAARRALATSKAPAPMPLISIDQAEELGNEDANLEAAQMLKLFRAAMDSGNMILVATIRSDSYGFLQNTDLLTGVNQTPFSLMPIAQGEIAYIVRGPAEALMAKVGRDAPSFSAEVVEELQKEMADESDALPLLAFALQRLVREHAATSTIGLEQLAITGGITSAIGAAANAALNAAGVATDPAERLSLLRAVFIPRLARVDPVTNRSQRRVAERDRFNEAKLKLVIDALIEKRLLVSKGVERQTLEVAHEALLRRWTELSDLLLEDREALLKLDVVQRAAAAWSKAIGSEKVDFLEHRGQRLADARLLLNRNDFATELEGEGVEYIQACVARKVKQAWARKIGWCTVGLAIIVGFIAIYIGNKDVTEGRRSLAAKTSYFLGVEAEQEYKENRFDRAMRIALAGYDKEFNFIDPFTKWTLARSAYSSRLLAELRGHKGGVSHAEFSPDGKNIVTSSLDKTARVWSADSDGNWSSQDLKGHLKSVGSAMYSPDGKRIVTRSNDSTARIWSADAKGLWSSQVLNGHTGSLRSATFSPDSKFVLTASSDNTARIWSADAHDNWSSQLLKGHTDGLLNAAFSRDSERVVTASRDKTARVWSSDIKGNWSSQILKGHTRSVEDAEFSPSGQRVITVSQDRTARVWSANSDGNWSSQVMVGQLVGMTRVAISPDGQHVMTDGGVNTAVVSSLEANGGASSKILEGHTDALSSIEFSPDSKRVVTASSDRTARVWSPDARGNWSNLVLEGHAGYLFNAGFSPDGERVVTASTDKTARVWSVGSKGDRSPRVLKGHTRYVQNAVFSPDGKRVVTASRDNTARVWSEDEEGYWSSQVLEGHTGFVNNATFSPDGKRIVTASQGNTVRVWSSDADGNWRSKSLDGHSSEIENAEFSRDGSRVVTASRDKTARVWSEDKKGHWSSQVLEGHTDRLMNAKFSPDGKRVVTASADKTARIWSEDVKGNWSSVVLKGIAGYLYYATFSPDGKRVVTTSNGNKARVWSSDSEGNWSSEVLIGHTKDILNAAFSPSGNRVVTASLDRTARVWSIDAEGNWSQQVLSGHTDSLHSAMFSPDGKRILTASRDNTARIWSADAEGTWSSQALKGHTSRVMNAVFSENGRRVVTASWDNTARVWDVQWLTTHFSRENFMTKVCEEKLPRASRLITHEDTIFVPGLRGREGEDVCEPFLKKQ